MSNIPCEIVVVHLQGCHRVSLNVDEKSTLAEAIRGSGVMAQFAHINLDASKGEVSSVGRFGQPCRLNERVKHGDRIEIYHSLTQTAMELREKRLHAQPKR